MEKIRYKEFYNTNRGIPEPKWGMKMEDKDYPLQCPTCGSQNMFASASSDDPEEIFPNETVRCGHCGHITDWYEALTQRRNHPTEIPREVVRC